jgi:hypothetical protein
MRSTLRTSLTLVSVLLVSLWGMPALLAAPAAADTFFFSTGNPDGKIATLSRQASPGLIETETADDFIINTATSITQATFTGLLPLGSPLSNVKNVEIEFYHVFPNDSVNPPSGNVPSRTNSPADVEIASATRDGKAGDLSFTASIQNTSFHVDNTVVNGIHKKPNQTTGGEGPTTGEETLFNITFNTPVDLPADHYFFRPEVLLADGNFLWLSAPKPILSPGTPFTPDLQSWTRNDDGLAPDWLRIGQDIVDGVPFPTFNATFSLTGVTIPEPPTPWLYSSALVALAGMRLARRRPERRVNRTT